MKKIFLYIAFLLTAACSYGQGFPTYQQFGSATTISDFKGAARGVKGMIIGYYTDTTSANNDYIDAYPFALIGTSGSGKMWRRNFAATKWEEISIGGVTSTPTWQQTLTAGSTLTGNNTINGGGYELYFNNNSIASMQAESGSTYSNIVFEPTVSTLQTSRSGAISSINVFSDSLDFHPHLGKLNIDTLTNLSTQNTLLGWKQGTGQGQVGYVTLGSGLSLSSGVLSSSGGTPGGSDTYIQFNDGGSFGGDAGFTYDKTTNVFSTNNGAYRPTGTISFSDAGAGSVYRSSSDGLVFRAVTGSGYDLLMYDAVGNAVFGLEAGTSKLGSTSQIGAGLLGYGSWNAWMNLRGGTTTNASLTIRDGVAPSSPAEGQIWRTTDKVYNVIQTGAATKEFTLNDIALTSGRIPYTTTNGRLTDVSTFVVNSGNVGIGTGSPSALLHVMSTTEQLRVGYDASNYFSTTVGSAGAVAIAAAGSSSSFNFSNRLSQKQGADVASASTIALGYDGNTFEITGTTTIDLITKTGWQNGSIIHLVFSDGLTVTNAVTSSGNDITIILSGASHFEATADDVLTLMLCEVGGTQKWVEVSRSVN